MVTVTGSPTSLPSDFRTFALSDTMWLPVPRSDTGSAGLPAAPPAR